MEPSGRTLTWNDIAKGDSRSFSFVVTPEDLDLFISLSGDTAPLHTDAAFAREQGFENCVVYGALMVAKLSRMISLELPGTNAIWTGLDINFRKPLYVGETATIELTVDGKSNAARMITLNMRIKSARGLIASGRLETILKEHE